jgi:hypothetical protein
MTRSPSEPPVAELTTLPDGAILITVGDASGIVHSDHLIQQKLLQVIAAWRRGQGDPS